MYLTLNETNDGFTITISNCPMSIFIELVELISQEKLKAISFSASHLDKIQDADFKGLYISISSPVIQEIEKIFNIYKKYRDGGKE